MVALAKRDNKIPQGKSNEWYTPARYIEAAREVMGGIDLDPASCELANETVKAARYFTEQEDGLAQEWYGRVWLNPPYSSSKSTVGLGGGKLRGPTRFFIEKLLVEYQSGNVSQAIVLCNADTNRRWFQCLWNYILCFASHPVHFYKPDDEGLRKDSRNCSFFGSCFAYLGPHEQKFVDVFSQFGTIAKRVSTSHQEVYHP